MYWEERFPRLLSTEQIQDLIRKGCPLVGVSDITCDIGGSIEFVNQTTSIDSPFFRYLFFFYSKIPLPCIFICVFFSSRHCMPFGILVNILCGTVNVDTSKAKKVNTVQKIIIYRLW